LKVPYQCIYAVGVSMPIATALTLAVLVQTIKFKPACITKPVRSNTPFGNISVSNSIHSSAAGLVVAESDTLQVIAELLLLQTDKVATVNVVAGTVYTVVFVAAAKFAVPNLPVAIINSPLS
jgi:hypothetical protein